MLNIIDLSTLYLTITMYEYLFAILFCYSPYQMESGGTVLSTNWKDVGSKKLDVKPPDGMEWKTWSS